MQQANGSLIENYLKQNRKRRTFRKFVQMLCCVVVFVTTYLLILPAITMEKQVYCGLDEHIHTDVCLQSTLHLTCPYQEGPGHEHGDSCFVTEPGHSHEESCYTNSIGEWNCTEAEGDEHQHNENCYQLDLKLVCEIPEESEPTQILICTEQVLEAHTHEENCYEMRSCVAEEDHTHIEECYVCGLVAHTHDMACYSDPEADEETDSSLYEAEQETPAETTEVSDDTIQVITQTAETENYIVQVRYSESLNLPEGTELRVTEYARDSEIFRQRCEEAGYELEWLLNIGFFQGDEELNLDGKFDVVVTSKQGVALGSDITHFAENGAEHIHGSEEDVDGVSFVTDGFSDFGGGTIATSSDSCTHSYTYNVTKSTCKKAGSVTYTCKLCGAQGSITSETLQADIEKVQAYAQQLKNANIKSNYSSGGFTWDTETKPDSWRYYNGVMLDAFMMVGSDEMREYVTNIYKDNLSADGTPKNYHNNEVDSVPMALALFDLLGTENHDQYVTAIQYVYDKLAGQEVLGENYGYNLRHKDSWKTYLFGLDGIYMANTFLMEYANALDERQLTSNKITSAEIYETIYNRVIWVADTMYDSGTGLYHHGWNGTKGNGHFWGRGIGWYAVALVDIIDMMPEGQYKTGLIAKLPKLFDGMLQYQDATTGMWYNVVNRDATLTTNKGNKLETSVSSMMAYALLKAYNNGWVIDGKYAEAGMRAFHGVVSRKMTSTNGTYSVIDTYKSSGVMESDANYLTNDYTTNEGKGVGALIMVASLGDHSWGAWSSGNTTRSTNTISGKKVRVCSECGDIQTKALPLTSSLDTYSFQVLDTNGIQEGKKYVLYDHYVSSTGDTARQLQILSSNTSGSTLHLSGVASAEMLQTAGSTWQLSEADLETYKLNDLLWTAVKKDDQWWLQSVENPDQYLKLICTSITGNSQVGTSIYDNQDADYFDLTVTSSGNNADSWYTISSQNGNHLLGFSQENHRWSAISAEAASGEDTRIYLAECLSEVSDEPQGVLTHVGYTFTTIDPSKLTAGQTVVLYTQKDKNYVFAQNDNKVQALIVNYTGGNSNPTTVGKTWEMTTQQITTSMRNFTWNVEKSGSNYLFASVGYDDTAYSGAEYLCILNEVQTWWNDPSKGGHVIHQIKGINGAGFKLYSTKEKQNMRYSNGSRFTMSTANDASTTFYLAIVEEKWEYVVSDQPSTPTVSKKNPTAVKTGSPSVKEMRFYNFVADEQNRTAILPGCTFRIRGASDYNADYTYTLSSSSEFELHLPYDIPVGSYTIEEVSVPAGYMRDLNPIRHFSITHADDGRKILSGDSSIGAFLNHTQNQLIAEKSAQVEDYNNRTYQILLNALSILHLHEMDPVDVLFVVDQSNSMLFPSGLVDTGLDLTIFKNTGSSSSPNKNCTTDTTLENWVSTGAIDRDEVYYIIAEPETSSTVYAIWYDVNNKDWMYQDASYYAKAYYENAFGYRQDNETAVFPKIGEFQGKNSTTGEKANGGSLDYDLKSSTLGKDVNRVNTNATSKKYRLYVASNEYNRLHFLQDALAHSIHQLADANQDSTVTLIRFTKVTEHSNCLGPYKLDPDHVQELVNAVENIETDGGTRQDIALAHTLEHLQGSTSLKLDDLYNKNTDRTFTVLITDGAPVADKLGDYEYVSPNGQYGTGTDDAVYDRIKGYGAMVREESVLITVGLGMGAVEGGSFVLDFIASADDLYIDLDDASELTNKLSKLLFMTISAGEEVDLQADITDVISDSFYPIAYTNKGGGATTGRKVLFQNNQYDWILLEPGDWVTIEGKYVGPEQGKNGVAQLICDSNSDLRVTWEDQGISGTKWTGKFYIKAKEDFIGGNAIDTNKSAQVMAQPNDNDGIDEFIGAVELPTPTVNVRLLDMVEDNSEVTVYLGDMVNGSDDFPKPLDTLKDFLARTYVTKLVAGETSLGYPIMNRELPSDNGLEADKFFLNYALQNSVDVDWERLAAGEAVTIPYTYDDDSSHGPVGYFTFQLGKTEGASYDAHEATVACTKQHNHEGCQTPAERYTLNVTYTAYKLGESGRPGNNVHYGSKGPGTEVGGDHAGSTLPEGKGIVEKTNIHDVHVISGAIQVNKIISNKLISDRQESYDFLIQHEDGSKPIPLTVTIEPGQTVGTSEVTGLKRGMYTVTEVVDKRYSVQDAYILSELTNTHSVDKGTEVQFYMGLNTKEENVIGPNGSYSGYIDKYNGIYGAVAVVNDSALAVKVSAEKIWGDGAQNHTSDTIYLVLYEKGAPVKVNDQVQCLQLNSANEWKGEFTVYLDGEGDTLKNHTYTLREVYELIDAEAWKNLNENEKGAYVPLISGEGENQVTTYGRIVEDKSMLVIGDNRYVVEYGQRADGTLLATNHVALELPESGGMGTTLYRFSGMLLTMAALIYGYSRRRKGEGRADA